MTPEMNNFRLIALDLDGTLTNEEKVITPKTYATLLDLQLNGVKLCLASGRPPYGMLPLAHHLHMEEYGGVVMAYNGGFVMDCATRNVIYELTLSPSLLPRLHAFQEQSGMTLMTYHSDTIYTEHPSDPYVAISSRNNNMRIEGVSDFVHDIPLPVHKCLMVGDPSKVPYWEHVMQESFGSEMNIMRSTPYFIELLPPCIEKGTALSAIASLLSIDMSDTIAFGDSYNDISMLRAAGIGVAMENADASVKDAADIVTGSNEADGVAQCLLSLVKK